MQEELNYFKSILKAEADALLKTYNNCQSSVIQAVDVAFQTKGHIIVCGVGKAGLIGKKISATLASLGFPSFFMHPTEAIHGDLGMVHKDDSFIVLSNSGSSAEITSLLPLLKRTTCPLIAITGNANSELAQHSDALLCYGSTDEVCPLNLAPTTSTTLMLAIGDALALTLAKRSGLTAEQYSKFHPGGTLGNRLLPCSEVMRPLEKLATTKGDTNIKDVLILISSKKTGCACILDDNGLLKGLFTDGDLRRYLTQHDNLKGHCVAEVMTKSPICISPNHLAEEALAIMKEKQLDDLPVVENNKLVGIIDIQDLAMMGLI